MSTEPVLCERISGIIPRVIRWRRLFHRCPETALNEYKTTRMIAEELTAMGYTAQPLTVNGHATGVLTELVKGAGPVITLRFDIDALPIEEPATAGHRPFDEGFVSENPGAMHACGHDGHIAMGLGLAALFQDMKDEIRGTLRFLFQPAEEGCIGAGPLVNQGIVDHTDYFFSGHITPESNYPGCSGDLLIASGSYATTKLDVSYRGKAAHGARQEEGHNCLLAMSQAVLGLYGIPRSGMGNSIINVGRVTAGTGRNVVPAIGEMQLEVRGETTKINDYMTDYAHRIITQTAAIHEVEAVIDEKGNAPSLSCSGEILELAKQLFHSGAPVQIDPCLCAPFIASEDAAHYTHRVIESGGKAAYFIFLTGTTASLHDRFYDFDESVLAKGIYTYASMIQNICQ